MDEKHIQALSAAVASMTHSHVLNYATPGLTSSLVGGGDAGKVRLFTSDRDTRHWITPHSHRFNFTCLVLAGSVENILYNKGYGGNKFCEGILRTVDGGLGNYELERATGWSRWSEVSSIYGVGETYSMRAEEIHSIRFSHDSRVLFFEGPQVCETTKILEPWSNGGVVKTFESPEWMFQRPLTGTDDK